MNCKKRIYNNPKKVKEVKRNGWYKICAGCYGLKLDYNPFPTPDELGNVRRKILK